MVVSVCSLLNGFASFSFVHAFLPVPTSLPGVLIFRLLKNEYQKVSIQLQDLSVQIPLHVHCTVMFPDAEQFSCSLLTSVRE